MYSHTSLWFILTLWSLYPFESFLWKRTCVVMDWNKLRDFITSPSIARPHLNVALIKVLKYEQTHGKHLQTAELFAHPVRLINAFMRLEGLKSFPVQKTPDSQSSSISTHTHTLDSLMSDHRLWVNVILLSLTLTHALRKSSIIIRLVNGQPAHVRGLCSESRSVGW